MGIRWTNFRSNASRIALTLELSKAPQHAVLIGFFVSTLACHQVDLGLSCIPTRQNPSRQL